MVHTQIRLSVSVTLLKDDGLFFLYSFSMYSYFGCVFVCLYVCVCALTTVIMSCKKGPKSNLVKFGKFCILPCFDGKAAGGSVAYGEFTAV